MSHVQRFILRFVERGRPGYGSIPGAMTGHGDGTQFAALYSVAERIGGTLPRHNHMIIRFHLYDSADDVTKGTDVDVSSIGNNAPILLKGFLGFARKRFVTIPNCL